MKKIMIVCVLLAMAACDKPLTERARDDEVTYMPDSDPAMIKAFAKARATLDDFLIKSRSPVEGTSGYAVKVGIEDAGNTEYFWISNFTKQGGRFSGRIDNEPSMVKTVKNGQIYTFAKTQIVDWLYFDAVHRRMTGNFTACALLTRESARDREAMMKEYGLSCDE